MRKTILFHRIKEECSFRLELNQASIDHCSHTPGISRPIIIVELPRPVCPPTCSLSECSQLCLSIQAEIIIVETRRRCNRPFADEQPIASPCLHLVSQSTLSVIDQLILIPTLRTQEESDRRLASAVPHLPRSPRFGNDAIHVERHGTGVEA